MSSTTPTTLVAGPATTNTIAARGFILIYGLIIWLAILPCFFLSAKLVLIFQSNLFFILVILPLYLFLMYFIFFVSVILWSLLILKITNLIHSPREGIFPRDPKNKDYRFWSLRAIIKKFPIWVCHNFGPFPWTDVFAFKVFGNQITYKSPVYDAWVDSEYIDIGRATLIGQGSVIMTSMITNDKLIIKRVIIGKNSIIGAHSVISPGTIVGDNTILGALSSTTIDQHLESNWVYYGNPAQKLKPSEFHLKEDPELEQALDVKYHEVADEIPSKIELTHRKGAKASLQLTKSDFKLKLAEYHKSKVDFQKTKAEKITRKTEQRLNQFEYRAEKHQFKADKDKYESIIAMEKAKLVLEQKIEKERAKLEKIEQEEGSKEKHRK